MNEEFWIKQRKLEKKLRRLKEETKKAAEQSMYFKLKDPFGPKERENND